MTIAKSRATRATAIAVCTCFIALITNSKSARAAERIVTNDNRVAAGSLAGETLTLKLEARTGEWKPDGDAATAVTVSAFAIEGGPLQVPGPLVRVREGTSIHVALRNRLDRPIEIHGFYTRPQHDAKGFVIPAGDSRDFTFLAGQAGTYFYWASSVIGNLPLGRRRNADTQLNGGFIVDPKAGAIEPDRVLIAGFWNNGTGAGDATNFRYVINGQSWPSTERLTYRVGDTVRIRMINTGVAVHPMHLHGFYFNVDSRGDEGADTIFPAASPHMVVTERLVSGATFALTWKPARNGNWLFHCHDNVHLQYGGNLDGSASPRDDPHHHVENHALEMMSGPIIGITVTGRSTETADASKTYRRLRLVAHVDKGGSDAEPSFAYSLDDASGRSATPQLPGPAIILKRGEPVAITVVNQLAEATTVHWHGIELESYFDGVAGFAGEGSHIAPPIPAGGSFEARFTPPRSGTFIYHTHIDEVRQQQAGLYGPLVVVDDPSKYDPQHDKVIMVTVPRTRAEGVNAVLINGSATPPATELRAGERYRLRFINLHISRPNLRMRVLEGETPRTWRAIAKDGRDLPADQAVTGPSEVQMGNGETYDFEFVPSTAGDLKLDVTTGNGQLLASMPIHVR